MGWEVGEGGDGVLCRTLHSLYLLMCFQCEPGRQKQQLKLVIGICYQHQHFDHIHPPSPSLGPCPIPIDPLPLPSGYTTEENNPSFLLSSHWIPQIHWQKWGLIDTPHDRRPKGPILCSYVQAITAAGSSRCKGHAIAGRQLALQRLLTGHSEGKMGRDGFGLTVRQSRRSGPGSHGQGPWYISGEQAAEHPC